MKTNKRCWCLFALRELLGLSLTAVWFLAAGSSATMAADTAGQPAAQQETAMTASESVTMNAHDHSSPGLAAGTTGSGGTSYSEGQVILTQGDVSGAGSITITVSATWEKRGVRYSEATLNAPSLWVSTPQAKGIDATITVTDVHVHLYVLSYTDTGTSADMTPTMKGGITTGDVTGTWTSAATPIEMTFGPVWIGIYCTFSGTRSVTINSR